LFKLMDLVLDPGNRLLEFIDLILFMLRKSDTPLPTHFLPTNDLIQHLFKLSKHDPLVAVILQHFLKNAPQILVANRLNESL
jgi:hypothetical protein